MPTETAAATNTKYETLSLNLNIPGLNLHESKRFEITEKHRGPLTLLEIEDKYLHGPSALVAISERTDGGEPRFNLRINKDNLLSVYKLIVHFNLQDEFLEALEKEHTPEKETEYRETVNKLRELALGVINDEGNEENLTQYGEVLAKFLKSSERDALQRALASLIAVRRSY